MKSMKKTFITPDLNGDEFEGSFHRISALVDSEDINKFCKDLNIKPDNLFLAISSFALSKFVYNKNLIFSNSGTSDGQSFDELALILNLNTDLNVKSFLDEVNDMWINSLAYHDLLSKIVDEYGFNTKFLYQFNTQNVPENKYNLILNVIENKNDFELICRYNDAIYSPELINTFLNSI